MKLFYTDKVQIHLDIGPPFGFGVSFDVLPDDEDFSHEYIVEVFLFVFWFGVGIKRSE